LEETVLTFALVLEASMASFERFLWDCGCYSCDKEKPRGAGMVPNLKQLNKFEVVTLNIDSACKSLGDGSL